MRHLTALTVARALPFTSLHVNERLVSKPLVASLSSSEIDHKLAAIRPFLNFFYNLNYGMANYARNWRRGLNVLQQGCG